MKTIKINIYEFDELGEQAKSKALTDYVYFNFQDDWWRNIYEDAERVYLKLNGFDIDRGAYCNGEWMVDAGKSANAIIAEHGDGTATYLLAKAYLQKLNATEDEQDNFLINLLTEYHQMLVREYDYLSSDDAIIDAFNDSDQLFTGDGQLANRLEKLASEFKTN